MNKVILMGRLTREPELKQTGSGVSVARFTIAVNRRFKNDSGEYQADFINCTAWRQTADFICKYFGKGSMIGVVGSIRTGSYQKDGQTVYTTDVNVDEAYFTGEKTQEQARPAGNKLPDANASGFGENFESGFDDFADIDGGEDDLPF